MPINYSRDKQRFRYTYGAALRVQQKNYALLRVMPQYPPTPMTLEQQVHLLDSNLFRWYDASFGITLDGGSVASWADKMNPTSSSYAMVNSSPSTRPSYLSSDPNFNGYPSLSGGTLSSGIASWPQKSLPLTYYIVNKTYNFSGYSPFGGGPPDYIFRQANGWLARPDLGALRFGYEQYFGDPNFPNVMYFMNAFNFFDESHPKSVLQTHVTYVCYGSSNRCATDTISTTLMTGFSTAGWYLDGLVMGDGRGGADFAEIRIYSVEHTDEQRITIMSYLTSKYGITLT